MSDHVSGACERVPQLTDAVVVEFEFPAETAEWADDLLRESWLNLNVRRTRDTERLIVDGRVTGNTNGIAVLRMVLAEIEEALDEGHIDPMEFKVVVRSEPS